MTDAAAPAPAPKRRLSFWAWIAITIGGLITLLIAAIILFFVFFPTELAAREAERRIEEATGRDLVLGGDVSITLWPALGFSAEQASLSNPEGFSTEHPFLAADRIVFAVAVMPLLRGQIEVKQLIFEGAQLRLEARANGEANWNFPTGQEGAQGEEAGAATIDSLRLDDVRLVNGLISFQGAEGEPLQLEDVDASLALESLDAPAQLKAAFNYRGERISIESDVGAPRAVLAQGETPLTANVRAQPVNASFNGAFNAATGALNGRVEASGSSLRRLMAWIGAPMDQGGGFQAFRVAAQMAREGERTAFSDAVLRLDDIEARGDFAMIEQPSGRLRINGTLSAGAIDLNPYLPAPAQGGTGAGGVEVDTAWSTEPLDLSGLRALDADMNLTLAGLRFHQMSFSDVALHLRLANGAADARLTRISLYQGAGAARLIADGSGAVPRIAVELNAQNVQAELLLRDAIGFDNIVGRGRLAASLVGQGASQAAIMRSLRGNASFSFNDGQWKGVNLAAMARTVQAAATGQAASAGGATDFAELAADMVVADGVAATENLRMLNPFVRLEGRGLIDIGAQTIDMRIAPRAVRAIEGQGGDVAAAGIGVPFRVSGPWAHVSFRPALEDVVQDQLRNVLRQRVGDNPLGQLGESLFGRAAGAPAPAPSANGDSAEQGAQQQPAPQQEPQRAEDRARDALGGLLRRAVQGERPKQEEPPQE